VEETDRKEDEGGQELEQDGGFTTGQQRSCPPVDRIEIQLDRQPTAHQKALPVEAAEAPNT
jgi:hypothetical protein